MAYADNADTIVHITQTGACYHRADCGALQSDIEATLRYAVEHGYLSCDRCNPPIPDFAYTSNPIREKHESSSGNQSGDSTSAPSPAAGPHKIEHEKSIAYWIAIAIVVLYVGCVVVFSAVGIAGGICCSIKSCLGKIKERKLSRLEEKRRIAEYTELYAGKKAESLCGMPPEFEIGPDGLPKEAGASHWGDLFTCYVTPSGHCYHKKYLCCRASIETHIHTALAQSLTPCSKCAKGGIPDLSWYRKYQEIKRIKDRYHIL